MQHPVVGQLLASLIATLAFGVVSQVPRKHLLPAAAAGAVGWAAYLFGLAQFSSQNRVIATFLGGMAVGAMGELFARHLHAPVTAFLVPGVIPLVPGADAYLTMLQFLSSRWDDGIKSATTTLFLAGAVAAGLILSGSLFRIRPRKLTLR